MCVSGVGDAAGDPLHGSARVRRSPPHDQQTVPPSAESGRETAAAG